MHLFATSVENGQHQFTHDLLEVHPFSVYDEKEVFNQLLVWVVSNGFWPGTKTATILVRKTNFGRLAVKPAHIKVQSVAEILLHLGADIFYRAPTTSIFTSEIVCRNSPTLGKICSDAQEVTIKKGTNSVNQWFKQEGAHWYLQQGFAETINATTKANLVSSNRYHADIVKGAKSFEFLDGELTDDLTVRFTMQVGVQDDLSDTWKLRNLFVGMNTLEILKDQGKPLLKFLDDYDRDPQRTVWMGELGFQSSRLVDGTLWFDEAKNREGDLVFDDVLTPLFATAHKIYPTALHAIMAFGISPDEPSQSYDLWIRRFAVHLFDTRDPDQRLAQPGDDPEDEAKYFHKRSSQKHAIRIENEDGWTALFFAVYKKNLEGVKSLLGFGADVLHRDRQQRTVLHVAAENKDTKILSLRCPKYPVTGPQMLMVKAQLVFWMGHIWLSTWPHWRHVKIPATI